MIITPPLRKATRVWGQFHDLVSLADFKKCITQGFGERPEYYGPGGHNGTDVLCPEGTEIVASHDGEASAYEEKDESGNFKGYGIYVTVRDRINGFKTEYCHLSKVVKTGQVKAGEVVGLSGNTGNSMGPHLHFTLKNPNAIDPVPYFVWFEEINNMELITKDGKEVWLVRDGKRSEVYNVSAFKLIGGNIDNVKKLTEVEFNAIPDSGIALAGLLQE